MTEISHDSIRNNLKKFLNENEPAPNTPEGVAVTALMIASKLLRENKKLVLVQTTEKAIFESDMPIESKFVLMFHILALIECTQPADKDEDEE